MKNRKFRLFQSFPESFPAFDESEGVFTRLPQYLQTSGFVIKQDFENVGDWAKDALLSIAANVTQYQTGTQSIKATTSCGGSSSVNMWCAFTDSIANIGTCRIRFYAHDSNLAFISLYIFDSTFTKYFQVFCYPYNLGWNIATIPKDAWVSAGGMTWGDSTGSFYVKVGTTAGGDTSVSVDTFEMGGEFTPSVLITFDDAYESVYSVAYNYMQTKQMKGTAYIPSGAIGLGGRMTQANLIEMDMNGWDIANHSSDGTGFVTGGLSDAQIIANLTTCKTFLDGLNLSRASAHLAYPNGEYNQTVIADAITAGILTSRTAYEAQPMALPLLFPYQIHLGGSNSYITDANALADVKARIDILVSSKVIGCLLFHGVGGAGEFSVANYQALMDYIISKGVQTLTISELYSASSSSIVVNHK